MAPQQNTSPDDAALFHQKVVNEITLSQQHSYVRFGGASGSFVHGVTGVVERNETKNRSLCGSSGFCVLFAEIGGHAVLLGVVTKQPSRREQQPTLACLWTGRDESRESRAGWRIHGNRLRFMAGETGEFIGKRERFKSLWGHDIWISWHAWQIGIRWQRACVTFATNKRTSGVS
jgi:hypothetical protein